MLEQSFLSNNLRLKLQSTWVAHSDRANWSDLSIGQISHIFLLLVKPWHMEKGKKKNGRMEKKRKKSWML